MEKSKIKISIKETVSDNIFPTLTFFEENHITY